MKMSERTTSSNTKPATGMAAPMTKPFTMGSTTFTTAPWPKSAPISS